MSGGFPVTALASVKPGDTVRVRGDYPGRGGDLGRIVYADEIGAELDFFCDAAEIFPAIEFWEWCDLEVAA